MQRRTGNAAPYGTGGFGGIVGFGGFGTAGGGQAGTALASPWNCPTPVFNVICVGKY